MNVAVVDGSLYRQIGGWGVRLITQQGQRTEEHWGRLPRRFENASCEARAILEAVRRAPANEPLKIYTDASGVARSCVTGHSRSEAVQAVIDQIRKTAQTRNIQLHIEWKGREGKHQRAAHQLARMGRLQLRHERPQVQAKITTALNGRHVHVEVRRTPPPPVRTDLPADIPQLQRLTLNIDSDAPLSAPIIGLQGLVTLLRANEDVTVKTDSTLLDLWVEQGFSALRDIKARKALAEAGRTLRKQGIRLSSTKELPCSPTPPAAS